MNVEIHDKKRSIAVDRIFVIGDSLNLDSEIIHLAVNILDMYINDCSCPNIQVICICCIRIAIKFYSDNIKVSYRILANYVSYYSPLNCFVKTEESILSKIDYKIPLITISTHILETVNKIDLTKKYNRYIRFNTMYLLDYLLFFPRLYYCFHYTSLFIGISLLALLAIKKGIMIYTNKYNGLDSYYKKRYAVFTKKRYIRMFMFV